MIREFLEKPHPFQVGFTSNSAAIVRPNTSRIVGRTLEPETAMNPTRAVKVIKSGERKDPEVESAGPNKWSTAVRSWVVEFQERDRGVESTPAFDSLFRDALPE
jgi:hypothetical protein